MRVATYNLMHCNTGSVELPDIAAEIRDVAPDIIGLQEVDSGTRRCGGVDQTSLLSEQTGLSYSRFFKAIDFDGGEYGLSILSRYPLGDCSCVALRSDGYEQRILTHAVLYINGERLDFFNTHLSFEDEALRMEQYAFIRKKLALCKHRILTGDLNAGSFAEYERLGEAFVNSEHTPFSSFKEGNGFRAIDNIFVSPSIEILHTALSVTTASDHNMLYADINLSHESIKKERGDLK